MEELKEATKFMAKPDVKKLVLTRQKPPRFIGEVKMLKKFWDIDTKYAKQFMFFSLKL